MTRVLMTADAVGGVWTYAVELARALARRDVAVTLATMGPAPTSDQIADADNIPGLDIVVSRFRLEWMEDPWRDVAAAGQWLLDLEARTAPAIVHLNGYAHAVLPFKAPVVAVGHSCVTSWCEAVDRRVDRDALSMYLASVRAGLRAADWIVAPTAAMLSLLQRHYGPFNAASVVSNGRTAARFAAAAKEPLIFCAGRLWDRAKNVQALVDAAPGIEWPIAIAGERDADRGGSERATGGSERSRPTAATAAWLGRLKPGDLASWLGRASICALPARYEPFGLLPLEAALSGCALVLGDIPSLREVWEDAAVFVDPDDRDALADTLNALTRSELRRRDMAERARLRARLYTPERMAAGYLNVYRCASRRSLPCAS